MKTIEKIAVVTLGLLLLALLVLVRYQLEGVRISVDTMHPGLKNGSLLVTVRSEGELERGDVVVVETAPDGTPNLVSRVVAVAGDESSSRTATSA